MNAIDPTDYVEAEEGQLNLKFGDQKQQAKFELGVCMAIYKWEELGTAVENLWGGANSAEKRDWISGIVIELFEEKLVDVQLIEETLLYAMVDEFDTEIDNDSGLEVAALVMKFYKEVRIGRFGTIDHLYEKWQQKQVNKTAVPAPKISIGADPNNPDISDSEEDEEEEGELDGDAMDLDEPAGPVVDDDGFELVQKKGRRRH